MYVADFETIPSDPTRVWLWVILDEQEQAEHGNDISSFFTRLERFKKSETIYFHNLKFDGSFIIVWAVKRGFKIVDSLTGAGNEIEICISDMGQFYYIYYSFKRGKKTVTIRILDSLKIINASVSRIAHDYNVGTVKGECDYNLNRPEGYTPTNEEIDYCYTDCVIIMRALLKLRSQNYQFGKRMTAGSVAFNTYRDSFRNKFAFNDWFPKLSNEVDSFLRTAYRGGYSFLNPTYKGTQQPSYVYDINSMYPFMMTHYPLPYGEPIFFSGEPNPTEETPLFIVQISLDFTLKPGHFACIQLKHNLGFNAVEYLETSNCETPLLTVTNVDLEQIFFNYDVENLTYYNGYYFRAKKGMFDDYINFYITLKQNSQGAERALAKLMLNSLYGKFGTNPHRRSKQVTIMDDKITFNYSDVEETDSVYVPVAIFVTSYGRRYIQQAAYTAGSTFIYCDTDSLHCTTEQSNIWIDSKELGAYKMEGSFINSKFLRAKCYVEVDSDGNEHYTVAGASKDVKRNMTLDSFKIGSIFEGKLLQKQVRGGAILQETTFQIKIM